MLRQNINPFHVALAVIAFGLAFGALQVIAAPLPLAGTWLTADGSSKVLFEPCAAAICGKIVWISDPIDAETGGPVVDKHNPNAALRSRPLVGITLLFGLKPGGDPNQWEGSVYNPEDGGVYGVTITLNDATHLELKGCLIAGLLCQGETWTKTADLGAGAASK